MSRHFVLGTWANADEYNYSGEQLMGHRQGKSVCMDHMLPSGMANLKRYGDPVEQKPKAPAKKKVDAFSSIMLADRNYTRLSNLSEALDLQLDDGELSLEDWAAARKNIDKRLSAAWLRVCKERNWNESGESLDNSLDDGLTFSLEDVEESSFRWEKQRVKRELTGWATIDSLSEENSFRGLFCKVKQVMLFIERIKQQF